MVPAVAFDVLGEFVLPELLAGSRGGRVAAALVPVPEAAMHEAHGPEPAEHEIGRSGEPPLVQAEPETTGVKGTSKHEFGLRVPASYPGHHAGTRGTIHYVRHLRIRSGAEGCVRQQVSDVGSFRIKSGPFPGPRQGSGS